MKELIRRKKLTGTDLINNFAITAMAIGIFVLGITGCKLGHETV